MTSDAADRTPLCPDCGALLEGDLAGCTQCGWRRIAKANAPAAETVAKPVVPTADSATPNPYQAPQAADNAGRTFGLGSLMLVITLIGVLLGVAMAQPGFVVAIVFVAAIALARTMGIIYRRKLAGGPVEFTDKVLVFLASLAIMTLIGAASGAAFYGTCWAGVGVGMAYGSLSGGSADYTPLFVGMIAGGGIGVVIAIAIFVKLAKRFWREKS